MPVDVPAETATKSQKNYPHARIVRNLFDADLVQKTYKSFSGDECFVKVGASEGRLRLQANKLNYKLSLDPAACVEAAAKGSEFRAPIVFHDKSDKQFYRRDPFQDLFAIFDMVESLTYLYVHYYPGTEDIWAYTPVSDESDEEKRQEMNQRRLKEGSLFRTVDRMRLIYTIIEEPKSMGGKGIAGRGAGLKLPKLQNGGAILGHFPLHNQERLQAIAEENLSWKPRLDWRSSAERKVRRSTPLQDRVRSYFGEDTAFYFAFVDHFTKFLIFPGILGLASYIYDFLYRSGNSQYEPDTYIYFGIFIVLWASVMLEYWKRKNAYLALEWGVHDFDSVEALRPEFINSNIVTPIQDPVTGAEGYLNYPLRIRRLRFLVSFSSLVFLMCLVLAALVGIIFFRLWFTSSNLVNAQYATWISGALNALQIQILTQVWTRVAKALNDFENHKTDTAYEDSLVLKTAAFQCVNNFSGLVYMAFVQYYVEGCGAGTACVSNLRTQLASIFLTRIFIGNVTELALPWMWSTLAKHKEGQQAVAQMEGNVQMSAAEAIKHLEDNLSSEERQFLLSPYGLDEEIADYLEVVIQFGFVTLFVPVFPLLPLILSLIHI